MPRKLCTAKPYRMARGPTASARGFDLDKIEEKRQARKPDQGDQFTGLADFL